MTEDRRLVAEFYMAALQKYGKRLIGVWLYSDGRVRRYETGGVRFLTTGEVENTYGALNEAAKDKPDAIILVTDEPGDDWDWSGVQGFPPIIAHCLRDQGEYLCDENLRHLVRAVGGQYIAGL